MTAGVGREQVQTSLSGSQSDGPGVVVAAGGPTDPLGYICTPGCSHGRQQAVSLVPGLRIRLEFPVVP